MAIARGASQPAAGQHTVAEWEAWLENWPLYHDEVVKAEEAWRDSFDQEHMHNDTYNKVRRLREENTRASKKQARDLLRGAFNSYLADECGRSQFATYFLKFPPAALDSLLEAWTTYREPPENHKHVQRSRAKDENTNDSKRQLNQSKCVQITRADPKHAETRAPAGPRHAVTLTRSRARALSNIHQWGFAAAP
jgi:hypothetical protein